DGLGPAPLPRAWPRGLRDPPLPARLPLPEPRARRTAEGDLRPWRRMERSRQRHDLGRRFRAGASRRSAARARSAPEASRGRRYAAAMTKASEYPPKLTPEQEELLRRAREMEELGRAMIERGRRRYFEARARLVELANRR